jgi:hypothetical protein
MGLGPYRKVIPWHSSSSLGQGALEGWPGRFLLPLIFSRPCVSRVDNKEKERYYWAHACRRIQM